MEKAPKFKPEERKILRLRAKETKGFKRVFRRKAF
jgi:hypothetical protein